jgi:hypothetical protein
MTSAVETTNYETEEIFNIYDFKNSTLERKFSGDIADNSYLLEKFLKIKISNHYHLEKVVSTITDLMLDNFGLAKELEINLNDRKLYIKYFAKVRPEANLLELDDYYQIEDWDSIGKFLIKNKDLISFLKEAAREISKVFSNDTEIRLELIKDPEISDDIELFATILTDLSVEKALKKVNDIEDNWFLDKLELAQGRFNFDVSWE